MNKEEKNPVAILSWSPEKLEKPSRSVIDCRIGDLKSLANVYGIHWLMFGPLFTSEATDRVCFLQPRNTFVAPSLFPDSMTVSIKHASLARLLGLFRDHLGRTRDEIRKGLSDLRQSLRTVIDVDEAENAEYSNSVAKLAGTEDIAIVHLTLRAGGRGKVSGRSEVHQHPGDELMLVLSGKLRVQLPDIGIESELGSGDYIHFYAEQRHSARSVGRTDARVLVIRYLQLHGMGTRYSLYSDVKAGKSWRKVAEQVRQEFLQTLKPFDLAGKHSKSDREIADRFGLGRFLKSAADAGRLTNKMLLQRATERNRELSFRKGSPGRLYKMEKPIHESELKTLADIYRTYPAVLYDFLYPAHQPVVQVRNPLEIQEKSDWETIPDSVVRADEVGNQSIGITYQVPRQRLAHSDMSISFLTMQPSAETAMHSHPGFELILPLSGKITIRQSETAHLLDHKLHLYAHFLSKEVHMIKNGAVESQLLVIRFYGGNHKFKTPRNP